MNQNPYLFVVGCPRSGTTLLQRMLDGHPQLAVANDTHFIPKAIGQVDPGVDPPMTPALLQAVRERSEEHTSELQSLTNLVCRLLLEKKKRVSNSVLVGTFK